MPVVNMTELLKDARQKGIGVGSFSVAGLEMIQGLVRAAEKAQTPVIMQIAQIRLNTSPLELIGPAMMAAAREAKVPIAVHLDHGMDLNCIKKALDLGFTSVMIDGSELPLEDNITLTRQVIALADERSAAVEAEIGRIGRTESGEAAPIVYAAPEDAIHFIRETNVDALAVGIGNSHGVYQSAPQLKFDVLENINAVVPTPLVLHGGTGLTMEDYRTAIAYGVRKINIATACFQAVFDAALEKQNQNIFDISQNMIDAMEKTVLEHLNIFNLI